jgi:hypothetical protein
MQEKRTQGIWWRRQLVGAYAPTLTVGPDGKFDVVPNPLLSRPQN